MRSCPRHAQSSSLHDLPRWVVLERGSHRTLNPIHGEPQIEPTLADRPEELSLPSCCEPTEVGARLAHAGQRFFRPSQSPTDCPKASHPSGPVRLASQATPLTEVRSVCSASASTAFGPPTDVSPRQRSGYCSDLRRFRPSGRASAPSSLRRVLLRVSKLPLCMPSVAWPFRAPEGRSRNHARWSRARRFSSADCGVGTLSRPSSTT
jgi:hypothetical protein